MSGEAKGTPKLNPDFSHRMSYYEEGKFDANALVDTVSSMSARSQGVLMMLEEVVEADRLDTFTKSTWHGIIDSLRSEIYDIEAVVNAFHEEK
jgi:hypothetical protein